MMRLVPSAMMSEGLAQEREIHAARVRELKASSMALEETRAQTFLEFPHLVTDGGLGHAELLRRAGKGEVTGGSLEGPQGIERRQTAR